MSKERPEAAKKEIAKTAPAFLSTLDGATISELTRIERQIQKVRDKVIQTAAKGYIEIGALLADARLHFTSDADFGKWRAERLPEITMHQANAMIRAYEVAQEAPQLVESCGLSVLQEIAYGGPKLIEWAKEKHATGEKITVAAVREERKSDVPPGWGGGGNEDKAAKVVEPDEPEVIPAGPKVKPAGSLPPDPQKRYKEALVLPMAKRVAHIKESMTGESRVKLGYLFMGLDPDPSCPHNPETFAAIVEYFNGMAAMEVDDEDMEWVVACAQEAIKDQETFE